MGTSHPDRRNLRRQLEAGELDELEFDAVVWRNVPNTNHVRFRDQDLPEFAASFSGVPFLRNHDHADIGSRDGTVITSLHTHKGEFTQRIKLTTARGIKDFLDGIIDRFSIAWYWDRIECSICGDDWMKCEHFPGRVYKGETAELIFINPKGKETSAVNTPAVPDTHVLAQLCQLKEATTMQPQVNEELRITNDPPAEPPAIPNSQFVIPELATLRAEVDTLRAQLAQQADRHLVTGIRPITAGQMQTPIDRARLAMDWMFGDHTAPAPPPSMRNVADLYLALTGDYNWYGRFDPTWAQLAAATTTTLAGMVVDSMNKVIMQHFNNMITYRWYEQIVNVLPHSGQTHPMDVISLDNLAVLPTVAEGAPYTELAVGDAAETLTFTKRGAYVGITLETIRRSDIQRLQAIPRELVKSAIRTRSAAIAAIFTTAAGAGPTLAQDTTALFAAGHGSNLMNGALAAATWATARRTIFEQTIPGGGSLGIWPSFCLVPIELYDTALVMFGYGAGDVGAPITAGTAQEVNPYAESRIGDPRPTVVVPEWTDATNWAAIVDPRLQPVIHMAYANAPGGGSHPTPEIFEVNSETSGLMFTNDTLPVKARDWWTHGVGTWVGIANNVNP